MKRGGRTNRSYLSMENLDISEENEDEKSDSEKDMFESDQEESKSPAKS